MSEPENFLSRWARLKREAAEAPDAAAPEVAADAPAAERPDDATALDASEPAFDLSQLPSIDSITATTDIRAFLAPGVPPELTRAALRRAWVADPTIRDFVGIAENQWDFNDPNGIPGFGPLGPLDDVRRLLTQVIGDRLEASEAPAGAGEKNLAEGEVDDHGKAAELQESGATEGDLSSPEHAQESSTVADERAADDSVAPQQCDVGEQAPATADAPVRRPHGGALPK